MLIGLRAKGKKSRCIFPLLVAWISVHFPVCGRAGQAPSRWEVEPSALSSPSQCALVLLCLFFLRAVHKAIPLPTFLGQMGSGSQERTKLHPVGAGSLPLAFLCSGRTPPPPDTPHTVGLSSVQSGNSFPSPLPTHRAFSTCRLPAGREQYFPK